MLEFIPRKMERDGPVTKAWDKHVRAVQLITRQGGNQTFFLETLPVLLMDANQCFLKNLGASRTPPSHNFLVKHLDRTKWKTNNLLQAVEGCSKPAAQRPANTTVKLLEFVMDGFRNLLGTTVDLWKAEVGFIFKTRQELTNLPFSEEARLLNTEPNQFAIDLRDAVASSLGNVLLRELRTPGWTVERGNQRVKEYVKGLFLSVVKDALKKTCNTLTDKLIALVQPAEGIIYDPESVSDKDHKSIWAKQVMYEVPPRIIKYFLSKPRHLQVGATAPASNDAPPAKRQKRERNDDTVASSTVTDTYARAQTHRHTHAHTRTTRTCSSNA